MDGATEIAGEETASTSSQSYPHTYTNQPVALQLLPMDQGYEESVTYYTLTTTNLDQTINLSKDTNA